MNEIQMILNTNATWLALKEGRMFCYYPRFSNLIKLAYSKVQS